MGTKILDWYTVYIIIENVIVMTAKPIIDIENKKKCLRCRFCGMKLDELDSHPSCHMIRNVPSRSYLAESPVSSLK